MTYISPLTLLARATDADKKSYPKDPDPRHWRTIKHSHVHIDKTGHIDGGAGGKFDKAPLTSTKHPHVPESYPDEPKAPEPPPKTAEDLRAAWKAVAKERMEIHRAHTEKSKKSHEEKLEKAYKAYTDMRSEIEARDPAEAAKFRPTTGGMAGSKKTTAGGPLGALAAATAPTEGTMPTPPSSAGGGGEPPDESPEVKAAAAKFRSSGDMAIKSYREYKVLGTPESLIKAKEALAKAEEAIKDMPADSEEFKKARRGVIETAKLEGMLGDGGGKLKDIFREIKTTPTPAGVAATPAPAAETSPLASLAKATSGRTASGASEAECLAGRAKIPAMKVYDSHRAKQDDDDYKWLGFTPKERQEFETNLRRIFENSSYGMNIDQKTLGLVLKSHFKNQYETKTGGGAVGASALRGRAEAFGHLLGSKETSVTSFPAETREKYGSLVSSDMGEPSSAGWYGDSLVRFKKSRLAGRVTYTCGDSLGEFGHDGEGSAAGDADHPSIATFRRGGASGTGKATLLKAVRESKDITELRSKLHFGSYMELQYHGELTADDIESVVLGSIPNPKIVKALKDKGIKVYYKSRYERGKPTEL